LRIWDVRTGRQILSPKGHTRAITDVVFSPDGLRLASTSQDGTVRIWDASNGRQLFSFKGQAEAFNAVAFSPDGRRLASGSENHTVRVWDTQSGQPVLALRGPTKSILAVVFSPDGRYLASGSDDHLIWIWNTETGELKLSLKGHTAGVTRLSFSPSDARRLASASSDHTVRLWDTESGEEVLSLKQQTAPVWSVAFSPDGQRLASASGDGTLLVWEARAPTADELRQRDAFHLVDALFDQWVHKRDVMDRIVKDASLSEALRREALARAERYIQEPQVLNRISWAMLAKAGQDRAAYRRAFLQAEEASRQAPDNGLYLRTLGVAQYRLEQYAQALESLTRSRKLKPGPVLRILEVDRTLQFLGANPADLAFRTMIQHRLGHQAEAQATLARLRQTMKQPEWSSDGESQSFLREAEALLSTSVGPPGK
jgi:hypothetical protein